MAVPLKILVIFIMFFTCSVVNCPPTARGQNLSKNVSVPNTMVDENLVINLWRKRREATRGHGCPIGKIFYITGCRTFKELEDDFVTSVTKTGARKTAKVQKDKYVKKTNVDLRPTPPRVQQEPHVLKSNPDSSMVPKSTLMKTKMTSSVSQSNIVRESDVQHLKNKSELSNVTQIIASKKTGITTFNPKLDTVKANQKPTAAPTETTPLPTGTRLTDADSGSSTTTALSRRIPGRHLLDIFFSEFATLTWIFVVLLGIAVVLFISYIYKYKKYQTEKEAAEIKTEERKPENLKISTPAAQVFVPKLNN